MTSATSGSSTVTPDTRVEWGQLGGVAQWIKKPRSSTPIQDVRIRATLNRSGKSIRQALTSPGCDVSGQ